MITGADLRRIRSQYPDARLVSGLPRSSVAHIIPSRRRKVALCGIYLTDEAMIVEPPDEHRRVCTRCSRMVLNEN
jgi:hypothetical protein